MLWTGFSLRAISIFCCVELSFYSVPCRWKTAPTAWGCYQQHFTFGMVLCMWWALMSLLSSKHDAWIWGSSDLRILFLTIWEFFRCFVCNSKCVFMCLYFTHPTIKPRSVECCSDVCSSVGFSYLHIWSWSSTRVTISFLYTTLAKALLHQLLSLARRPALGRVLVVPNIFCYG